MNVVPDSLPRQTDATPEVDDVLAIVRRRAGLDFTRHRRATVARRIRNRMISAGAGTIGEYLALLSTSPEEVWQLVERLTIKVSRFYRHRATFDALRFLVLPALVRERGPNAIRAWCAGCGRGEEPYTLAMLLEELGAASDICATDIDPRALEAAPSASFSAESLDELPQELIDRYLIRGDGAGTDRWSVVPMARSRVRFARHDLTSGDMPPGAPFDVVTCRNVLIYLEPDAQARVFECLLEALEPGGVLCLGEVEWPPAIWSSALEPLASGLRLFRRWPTGPRGTP